MAVGHVVNDVTTRPMSSITNYVIVSKLTIANKKDKQLKLLILNCENNIDET